MLLFKKVADLQCHLAHLRAEGKTIGFVPTMGALHEGHVSLIQAALHANDCVVCSIFVNPAQFNDPADLQKYPRTTAADIGTLIQPGCQVLFLPPVEEIYPESQKMKAVNFDFGYLAQPMEGAHRPGHFDGVAKVVHRLLEIVEPDRLYMGQKDFQQLSIVRKMLQLTHSPVHLVGCPIVREADGLAMSSRNVLLGKNQRAVAPMIFKTLSAAKNMVEKSKPAAITDMALEKLNASGMAPEYFEIADGRTLKPVRDFENADFVVACTAVMAGNVRLIDNMVLKGTPDIPCK
jgi:pantoate--beta-alanine ligase